MNQITLKEYVKEHGQVRAGAALGVTQIGREIFVVISEEGTVSAFENKAFPSKRRSDETRA